MIVRNLFSALSSYRPGSTATPFENYCTGGLAYLLSRQHEGLRALLAAVVGQDGGSISTVEIQAGVAGDGLADLLLTYESGRQLIVEVRVEPAASDTSLPGSDHPSIRRRETRSLVVLDLNDDTGDGDGLWNLLSWSQVSDSLEDDGDPLVQDYVQFIKHDILGLGEVTLEEALSTNRLYALGGAAVRRVAGNRSHYQNSASQPVGGRYRYLGTTFALNGGELEYWVGVVNEEVPLSDHFHLMLASREKPVSEPVEHPRATGDWKWQHWTGLGRVIRPVTPGDYDELMARLS